MKNQLVQYVKINRGKLRGQLRGVVIAVPMKGNEQERYRIGWSYTNLSAKDSFDKEMGLGIALGRALGHPCQKTIPRDVVPILSSMKERAERYFKA